MDPKKFNDIILFETYFPTLTNGLSICLEKESYIDLVFVCRNGRKVGSHQLVLSSISPFLRNIIKESRLNTVEKEISICVPDISATMMTRILHFIYHGSVMVPESEFTEFNENLILFGMPMGVMAPPQQEEDSNKTSSSTSQNDLPESLPAPQEIAAKESSTLNMEASTSKMKPLTSIDLTTNNNATSSYDNTKSSKEGGTPNENRKRSRSSINQFEMKKRKIEKLEEGLIAARQKIDDRLKRLKQIEKTHIERNSAHTSATSSSSGQKPNGELQPNLFIQLDESDEEDDIIMIP